MVLSYSTFPDISDYGHPQRLLNSSEVMKAIGSKAFLEIPEAGENAFLEYNLLPREPYPKTLLHLIPLERIARGSGQD